MGQWVAAFFVYGMLINPRLTRFIAAIFNIVAISDFMHIAYSTAMSLSTRALPNTDE